MRPHDVACQTRVLPVAFILAVSARKGFANLLVGPQLLSRAEGLGAGLALNAIFLPAVGQAYVLEDLGLVGGRERAVGTDELAANLLVELEVLQELVRFLAF